MPIGKPSPAIQAGQRFGRWCVIAPSEPRNSKHPAFQCRCECGKEKVVAAANLRNGVSASCGCLRIEQLNARSTTHGMSYSNEYRIWYGMIDRCSRLNSNDFVRYGGRGIRVCRRWLDSFESFYADMGPRPSIKHSIDRINNHGDYEPTNCRWATSSEQALNKSCITGIEWNGHTKTIAQWSKELGIPRPTLRWRIRRGWALHRVMAP